MDTDEVSEEEEKRRRQERELVQTQTEEMENGTSQIFESILFLYIDIDIYALVLCVST